MARPEELIGRRFGQLTVDRVDRVSNGSARFACACDCGKRRDNVCKYFLTNGSVTACKVCVPKRPAMAISDGSVFGLLTVAGAPHQSKGETYYPCACACGRTTNARRSNLTSGATRSCGCERRRRVIEARLEHGMSHTAIHRAWVNMLSRCEASHKNNSRYAARGIKVCDRWLEFANFAADMGNRPSTKHSIDRIDNNGNYEPGNCRWATSKEQNRNRCDNVWIEVNGARVLASDMAILIREARAAAWQARKAA